MFPAKFHIAGCILLSPFLKMHKIWPFYDITWSSHGPSNQFFLNHNQCAGGCSKPNFTLLGASCSLEMAKI